MLFLCLCKPEFLTCIIFFLTSFHISCKAGLQTTNYPNFCLLDSLFLLHFWKIIMQVQNSRLVGFSTNTLNIHYLVFLLHGFWEVGHTSYLCSSTGKVFSSSGFFPGFFLYPWFSVVWKLQAFLYFWIFC